MKTSLVSEDSQYDDEMIRVNESVIKRYEEQGYVVLPEYFSPQQMLEMSHWTDEICAWPEVPGRHMVYYEDSVSVPEARVLSRVENFCPFHSQFNSTFNSQRVMKTLAALLGEEAVMFKDKINFKLPGSGGFEPHQDVQAGWDQYATLHISMLVSIDPATQENGCLEIAGGWHDRGLVGESWKPLGDEVPDTAYQSCPTQVGDVVIFDSFVPHRSFANSTDSARRILYITYNRLSEGDHRQAYYADKRASYPPDCEREAGKDYVYRV